VVVPCHGNQRSSQRNTARNYSRADLTIDEFNDLLRQI
jgi:hypothetical protein